MPLNIELAERVLAKIAEYPDHHNQDSWRASVPEVGGCGTTMCIAGWAGYLAGGKWASDDYDHDLFDDFLAEPDDPESHVDEWTESGKTIRYVSAEDRGRRVLGLSGERADQLFWCSSDERAVAMLRRSIRSAKAARTRRGDA